MKRTFTLAIVGITSATMALAHGDVTPQAVNTDALPEVGEEWLIENPYRAAAVGDETWEKAVEIGASGYTQNCARCHGLGAVSGGLAPDLRYLEAEEYGDEWYVERFQFGYTQDGTTKMPAFGEVLGQKAAWAIRTYIETRPDDGAIEPFAPRLTEIRDSLLEGADVDAPALKEELAQIALEIPTASGAPVADSIAFEASHALSEDPASWKASADLLTVGLSAAE
ncbi:Quinohemoprotein alcohol dehydrogenase ADH-IIG precursor [Aquimixticola soesokkakensis]|uniref:Quinohemoprotein alcohol dehydrogenase ADH-IIG n=1 Tax=Aquimixticola soesokkakensis TaxID=1519096 RepID=A0A1Y5RVA6_9RHOB|nr:cytochrome c-550 PedF [Aquimixticola soesokkakensis]SLN25312.1 Quinohemoprotein alcohol dehydrogenase ADH-IIG precursor [Aquimixticola soesokkakensis]